MSTSNLIAMCSLLWAVSNVSATTITFDDILDSEALSNQYSSLGVSFVNGMALSAGLSLNEVDFPPHSGSGVASDDLLSSFEIRFSAPVSSVSAWFTYSAGLQVDAFDDSNMLVGSIKSLDQSNLGTMTQFALAVGNIRRLSFTNTPLGTYVLDDLTFLAEDSPPPPPPPPAGVPEPSTLAVLCSALFAAGILSHKRKSIGR